MKKNLLIRIFLISLVLIAILFLTPIAGFFIFDYMGFIPMQISVSATGSMYPTFPKSNSKNRAIQSQEVAGRYSMFPYPNGLVAFGKRYFNYNLQRGDIVVAENEQIRKENELLYGTASGVVKRIIALPGDSVELKNGIVYLNGNPLKEPYTAKSHSTFGNKFIEECKNIRVPENKIIILGDNRKASGDSRYFGFVDEKDIGYVLPWEKQKGILDKNFRDVSEDLSDATKIKLDKVEYLKLLNEKRKSAGVKTLTYQPLLEKSATFRAGTILKFNDFSFEASRSGYTMEKAMEDAEYSNIIYGEVPIQGYYDADELFENQFQFKETKDFLLHKDYEEVGIAVVEGEINGCPTQIIVEHFAGYIPPNYKKEDIETLKKVLTRLKEIQTGWKKLTEDTERYEKSKINVDRINEIIEKRIQNMTVIIQKMQSEKWLNKQEMSYITEEDTVLTKEQNELAEKLNKRF